MARPSFAQLLQTPGRHPLGDSLYLTVLGDKSKRFEFRMRFGAKLKSFWLGSAIGPGALSLTAARAERARVWLDNRGNPANRALAVTGKRFTEGLEEWLAANRDSWAVKSVEARRGLAKLSLASLDIGKITQADVIAALANETPRMHAEKRGWLADLFSFAKAQQWRTGDNPARFDADTRHGFAKIERGEGHAHIAPAELATVYAALPNTVAGNAVRFTILTAARAGETEGATFKEVVGDNGTTSWEINADRMKAKKAHRVPLVPAALALLDKGEPGAPLFELKANTLLNTLKKVRPGATVHGLRATFKTWASEAGKDRELTERSLAHDFGSKVENAYQRSDLFDRRRTLLTEWAEFVTGTK
jgi:integrase